MEGGKGWEPEQTPGLPKSLVFFKRRKKPQNNNGRERRKLEVKDVAIPEA